MQYLINNKIFKLLGGMAFGLFANSLLAAEKNLPEAIKTADSDIAGNLIQTTLGLIVILVIIAGVAWFAKRFGNFKVGAQGRMKIVGGLSVGTRERIVLLQVGEQQLVVGVAPGRIQTLHVLAEPLPVESTMPESRGFAEKLSMAMNHAKGRRD